MTHNCPIDFWERRTLKVMSCDIMTSHGIMTLHNVTALLPWAPQALGIPLIVWYVSFWVAQNSTLDIQENSKEQRKTFFEYVYWVNHYSFKRLWKLYLSTSICGVCTFLIGLGKRKLYKTVGKEWLHSRDLKSTAQFGQECHQPFYVTSLLSYRCSSAQGEAPGW